MSTKRFLSLTVLGVLPATIPEGHAQEAPMLKAGDWVRVTAPIRYRSEPEPVRLQGLPSRFEASVIRLSGDTLVVDTEEPQPQWVLLGQVEQIELRVGLERRGIGRNALIGLGVGAAIGGLTCLLSKDGPDSFCGFFGAEIVVPFFGGVGAALGATVGAAKKARWNQVYPQ